MTLLVVASRYHDTDPRRGPAVQVSGLARALRQLGQHVVLLDPFRCKEGQEGAVQVAEVLRVSPPRGAVAIGPQPESWSGWPTLGEYLGRHGVPLATLDVTDPVCRCLADVRLASWREKGVGFLPPAVDPEIYRPGSPDRDLAFAFVGRLCATRREALSHLRQLPGFVHDSGRAGEPRIPQHAMAAILSRSVVGVDLPGRADHALHPRVFETLAASAYPVAPFSAELASCLEPDKEVMVYHDSGEMVELVQRINQAPQHYAGMLAAGRKRVLAQHGFSARARTLLGKLADCAERPIAAQPVGQKKVTIYMPVHNAERFLDDSLDSVLGQTWRNLNVIALNDASSDRTASILDARAAKDPRLTVVHNTVNRGDVVRRNDALMKVPDDTVYLSNHDADDISDPTKIERLVEYLEANPQVSLVGCHARILDESGCLRDYLRLPSDSAEIDRTFHEVNPLLHSAVVYRRSVLDRLCGYRNVYRTVDDYDFWGRALEAGYRLANVPEPLVQIRVHGRNISSTNLKRQDRMRRLVAARVRESLPWRLASRKGRTMQLRAVVHGGIGGSTGRLNVDSGSGLSVELQEDFHYLRMPPASVAELWVHNCLEQLPRAAGLRALIEWHTWLEEGGQLMLETPDLRIALDRLHDDGLEQSDLLRHLFGGQAMGAAAHLDAYDEARLRQVLSRIGFSVEGITQVDRDGLPYVIAQCRKHELSVDEQNFAALDLLEDFLMDTSEVEVREEWHRQLSGLPSMGNVPCVS